MHRPTRIQLVPPGSPTRRDEQLQVDIAGAGPVGLALALWLRELMPSRVRVRLFDPRLVHEDGSWSFTQGRRRQVVTLQSKLWHALPRAAQRSLFRPGSFSEVWPHGADSPPELGRPRNLPIADIEDGLLAEVQRDDAIALHVGVYQPAFVPECSVLAICDGAHSRTREHFRTAFGTPHPSLYALDGQPLRERVLGLEVEGSALSDGELVLLTLAQNRFLLNAHRGRGFLNMRLTPAEASELEGGCSPLQGCSFHRQGEHLCCVRHRRPLAIAPESALWPRVRDGLRLFGADESRVQALSLFEIELQHRPRFVAELPGGTVGCLLGDAANALHLWPGRGLNSGLKSALSLARCLAGLGRNRLRVSDLLAHEGAMQMLQAREIDLRAQRTMLMRDSNGVAHPIASRIERGLQAPVDRSAALYTLRARIRAWREHLAARMGPLPPDSAWAARFAGVSDRTLSVLVASGAWISNEIGGREVDIDALFPPPPRVVYEAASGSTLRIWRRHRS